MSKQVVKKKKKINVTEALLHVKATLKNTIVTVTDMNGNAFVQYSAGQKFKNAKKRSPHAAAVVADDVARWCKDHGITRADILLRDIGAGRDMVVRTVSQRGLNVRSICDRTRIPHGGCRPRKARRN